jgi:hypothetical protein
LFDDWTGLSRESRRKYIRGEVEVKSEKHFSVGKEKEYSFGRRFPGFAR